MESISRFDPGERTSDHDLDVERNTAYLFAHSVARLTHVADED
jgi:hypothetical protein